LLASFSRIEEWRIGTGCPGPVFTRVAACYAEYKRALCGPA
jgi:hypothetical protein